MPGDFAGVKVTTSVFTRASIFSPRITQDWPTPGGETTDGGAHARARSSGEKEEMRALLLSHLTPATRRVVH